jgi:hypothetical protein
VILLSKLTDSIEDWIQSFKSGKTWFNKLSSADTKKSFLSDFKLYCDSVGKNPDELISLKEEGLKNIATEKNGKQKNFWKISFRNAVSKNL